MARTFRRSCWPSTTVSCHSASRLEACMLVSVRWLGARRPSGPTTIGRKLPCAIVRPLAFPVHAKLLTFCNLRRVYRVAFMGFGRISGLMCVWRVCMARGFGRVVAQSGCSRTSTCSSG
jgi:hypothetical protein